MKYPTAVWFLFSAARERQGKTWSLSQPSMYSSWVVGNSPCSSEWCWEILPWYTSTNSPEDTKLHSYQPMSITCFSNPLFTSLTGDRGGTRGKGESILKRPYFSPGHRDKVSILDNIGLKLLGGEIQLHVLLLWSSSDRQMEGGKTEYGYIYIKNPWWEKDKCSLLQNLSQIHWPSTFPVPSQCQDPAQARLLF